jgi:hypothetical protein
MIYCKKPCKFYNVPITTVLKSFYKRPCVWNVPVEMWRATPSWNPTCSENMLDLGLSETYLLIIRYTWKTTALS